MRIISCCPRTILCKAISFSASNCAAPSFPKQPPFRKARSELGAICRYWCLKMIFVRAPPFAFEVESIKESALAFHTTHM